MLLKGKPGASCWQIDKFVRSTCTTFTTNNSRMWEEIVQLTNISKSSAAYITKKIGYSHVCAWWVLCLHFRAESETCRNKNHIDHIQPPREKNIVEKPENLDHFTSFAGISTSNSHKMMSFAHRKPGMGSFERVYGALYHSGTNSKLAHWVRSNGVP